MALKQGLADLKTMCFHILKKFEDAEAEQKGKSDDTMEM
jgi:hypothetical protein